MFLARTATSRLSTSIARTILARPTINSRAGSSQVPKSLVAQERLCSGTARQLATQRPWSSLTPSSFQSRSGVTLIPALSGVAFASVRWKSDDGRTPGENEAGQTPQSAASEQAQSDAQRILDEAWNKKPEPRQPKTAEKPQQPQKPQKPLPDLRYGIPSTFQEEYLKDSKKTQEEAPGFQHLDITDAEPEKTRAGGGGGGRSDGEIPKAAYESSIDRRRNRMAQYFFISMALSCVAGAMWMGRDWESEEEAGRFPDAPSGWGFGLFYNRIEARIKDRLGYYTEPAFPKLLPVMKDQPMPPYTLVLSLEDMLVHSEWTREHGWRTAKRPGIDFFLLYLSQYYELCLFTSVPSAIADPVYRKLDPYHLIQWPLFREATRYENGQYIKDLSYLNRPLNRTILLDTKASHGSAQPDNAIIIPPWTGDPNDRELLALIPFLEYLAMMGIEDVRGAIKSFAGAHIPSEFAAREARMREQFFKDNAALLAGKKGSGGLKSIAERVVKNPAAAPGDQAPPSLVGAMREGKTPMDVMRAEGMKRYRLMEKEIRDNGERWLREEAELMKRLELEQMKQVKSNPLAMLGLGAPAKQLDPQEVMAQLQREREIEAAAAAAAVAGK